MILIDGQTYDVDVVSIERTGDFLDKAADRTDDGDLHRELLAVYFNYQMKFGPGVNTSEYARLWDKLTEPVEYHTVTVPYGNGSFTYTAYFSNVKDKMLLKEAEFNFFTDLSVNFIAKVPARRPGG